MATADTQQTKTKSEDVVQKDILPDPIDDTEQVAEGAPEDVSDAADRGPELPPKMREKADRLAEAARLYREKRDREEQEFKDKHGPAEEPAAEEEAPAVAAVEPPAVTKPAPAPLDDEAEIDLIVYGSTVKKKLKDLKADAQKLLAADQKFDEATRLLQEAKAIRNAPAQRGNADPEHPLDDEPRATRGRNEQTSKPEHQPADDLDAEALDSIVERIQVGDKDEGRAALADLAKLIMKGNTSPLNETQVRDRVRQELHQVDTEKEIKDAVDKFAKQFPTIASDDDFSGIALQRVERELKADLKAAGISDEALSKVSSRQDLAILHGRVRQSGGNVRSYDALLTDVGTHFSSKFGTLTKPATTQPSPAPTTTKPTPPAQSAVQQRVEMKRAAAQQPRAAGARAPVAQGPRPKTPQEIIAEIRRSRKVF